MWIELQPLKIWNIKFEDVFRYRDAQLQMAENVCDLWNLSPNMFQCWVEDCYFWANDYTSVLIKIQNLCRPTLVDLTAL